MDNYSYFARGFIIPNINLIIHNFIIPYLKSPGSNICQGGCVSAGLGWGRDIGNI